MSIKKLLQKNPTIKKGKYANRDNNVLSAKLISNGAKNNPNNPSLTPKPPMEIGNNVIMVTRGTKIK